MAIGDIYQLNVIATLQGQTVENVLHYQVTADADASALANGLHSFAADPFALAAAAFQSQDLVYALSRVQKIFPIPAFIATEQAMFQSGLITTQALPSEVAGVITKQSFLAGRAFRGRIYMAGIPSAAVLIANGRFDATTVTAMNTLGTNLTTNVLSTPSGGIMKPVIYHRLIHTTTDITTALARDIPRMQRRRQIGRGI